MSEMIFSSWSALSVPISSEETSDTMEESLILLCGLPITELLPDTCSFDSSVELLSVTGTLVVESFLRESLLNLGLWLQEYWLAPKFFMSCS